MENGTINAYLAIVKYHVVLIVSLLTIVKNANKIILWFLAFAYVHPILGLRKISVKNAIEKLVIVQSVIMYESV